MPDLSIPNVFTAGTPARASEVNDNFNQIAAVVNDLDSANFDSTTNDRLGLTTASTTRRGKSIIATEQVRTNTAYGTLTTADSVSIALPTDGLIVVGYQATWKESVMGASRAALFLGANQVQVMGAATTGGSAPRTQEALLGTSNAGQEYALCTCAAGLVGLVSSATGFTGDATTGQILGSVAAAGSIKMQIGSDGIAFTAPSFAAGPCLIFAAAGTYTVSVQFKSSSGSVTVKNRKLWIYTLGF